MQRRNVMVGGVRLTYLEREAALGTAKPPLLVLHGIMASAEAYREMIAALPEERRIVALDLPGEGDSERDVSFAGLAKLVMEFAQTIGLGTFVLMGHSHGGVIALRIGVSYPERLEALVLLCPAHPYLRRERVVVRFYNSRVGNAFARSLPRWPDWALNFAKRSMLGTAGGSAVYRLMSIEGCFGRGDWCR